MVLDLQGTRSGEDGHKLQRVVAIIAVALGGSRIGVVVTNAEVTRREDHRYSTGTLEAYLSTYHRQAS